MTQWEFYKRRIIRLQPMAILGMLLGGALFYFEKSPIFPLLAVTPVAKMLLVLFLGCLFIPVSVSMDIRGWHEMYPLNSAAWSLFYEYIANIFYAAGLRKLSRRWLIVLTTVAAVFLSALVITRSPGDADGGYSLTGPHLRIGFARLLFPFLAGLLLMRIGKRIRVPHSFAITSVLLIAAFSLPRFGGTHHYWRNGLFESLCILFVFPLIVAIAAGETRVDGSSIRIARFFGDISYPLYITHYPLIYLYTAHVIDGKLSPARGALWGIGLFILAVAFAYACLKLCDEPVRRWLSRRFLALC